MAKYKTTGAKVSKMRQNIEITSMNTKHGTLQKHLQVHLTAILLRGALSNDLVFTKLIAVITSFVYRSNI